MRSSLPCFLTFCRSGIPTSCYILNVFCYLLVIGLTTVITAFIVYPRIEIRSCVYHPVTNIVYHLRMYSLELLCSCSHAGMDTFVLHSVSCSKMLPPQKPRMTGVIHHCTMLAGKFLLLVLCVSPVPTE